MLNSFMRVGEKPTIALMELLVRQTIKKLVGAYRMQDMQQARFMQTS